jgi:hypothetical protein
MTYEFVCESCECRFYLGCGNIDTPILVFAVANLEEYDASDRDARQHPINMRFRFCLVQHGDHKWHVRLPEWDDWTIADLFPSTDLEEKLPDDWYPPFP